MIVPFAKTSSAQAQAPAQAPPSEAALLMALAEMHKQGRFQTAGDKFPDVDHEEPERPEQGKDFETLYKQLEDSKDKVKPGNLLRLYDKKGNDFYYKRDDNLEHGFSWHPKPPDETS